MSTAAKDLSKESPASPAVRVGGYVILARMADKTRAAFLGGNVGEYHAGCPLDMALLNWKNVPFEDIKQEVIKGADNPALSAYLDTHGEPKTREETAAWSDSMDAWSMANDPEKGEYFRGEVSKLGLDPASTTVFQWLEADDKACH